MVRDTSEVKLVYIQRCFKDSLCILVVCCVGYAGEFAI